MVRLRESLDEITEVLVEIRFAIAIFVSHPRDLIAAENIDLIVDDLESERLIEAGGKTFPRQLAQ